jgi:uncharacterized protein YukJ
VPLKGYGVLKGKATDSRREDGQSTPHFQVHVLAAGVDFRLAVNISSQASPSELMFLVDDDFKHPITDQLAALPDGFTGLASAPGGAALDFIRGNLFDRSAMKILPPSLPGPDNDLSDRLEHFFARAIGEAGAMVYTFGQRWGPEPTTKDKTFGFLPGNGVHDIHMNQGNVAPFLGDDGVWQDGGVLLWLPATSQWVAVFLAFQSQAWHTDDITGHTLADVPAVSDQIVRIVGALINPIGPAPEHETVTLLNASAAPINLAGWQIMDRLKHKHPLSGNIAAGATLVVSLPPTVQLGNSGGLVTLLDAAGLKVDGVSYTADQAKKEGWTVVF